MASFFDSLLDSFDFIANSKMLPYVSMPLEVVFSYLSASFKSKHYQCYTLLLRKGNLFEFKIYERQPGMFVFSTGGARPWGTCRVRGCQDLKADFAEFLCQRKLGRVVPALILSASGLMGSSAQLLSRPQSPVL